MPKDWILKHLDLMALHKLNVFHWHLTEDQGWRIEIRRYPKLTAVGAWRADSQLGLSDGDGANRRFEGKPHGGYYTQADVRERARARETELGLRDEDELQSWFVGRMDSWLSERGRRLVGWDEILEGGLAPGATVMSWRGEAGGIAAAKAGHDVVMAPEEPTYLDHSQSELATEPQGIGGHNSLEDVYRYEPIPAELNADEAKHVLGSQGQVWTEYMPDPKRVEYMAWPRLAALAEVLWSPKDARDWDGLQQRLAAHLERLAVLDVT